MDREYIIKSLADSANLVYVAPILISKEYMVDKKLVRLRGCWNRYPESKDFFIEGVLEAELLDFAITELKKELEGLDEDVRGITYDLNIDTGKMVVVLIVIDNTDRCFFCSLESEQELVPVCIKEFALKAVNYRCIIVCKSCKARNIGILRSE